MTDLGDIFCILLSSKKLLSSRNKLKLSPTSLWLSIFEKVIGNDSLLISSRQLGDVGDGFDRFCHHTCHPLVTNIYVARCSTSLDLVDRAPSSGKHFENLVRNVLEFGFTEKRI